MIVVTKMPLIILTYAILLKFQDNTIRGSKDLGQSYFPA